MGSQKIDINCDVGEGMQNEAQLFPLITSCNIACGGHAGDAASIREILQLAMEHKVKVGAHPSYPDKENFGRRSMELSEAELIATVFEQVGLFFTLAAEVGIPVHHIKAHGALYNDIAADAALARTYLRALEPYHGKVLLYVPYKSAIAKEAEDRKWTVHYEAFADRNYNADRSLVPRSFPEALITDPEQMSTHLLRMYEDHMIHTVDGTDVPILADTYCIHGDTPGAVELLATLVEKLDWHGIELNK